MSDYPIGKQYIIQGDRNQAVQGDRNLVSQSQVDAQNAIAVPEILELIAQIKQQIEVAELSPDLKTKALRRLDAATEEVKEAEPDKQHTAGSLKRMGEALSEASKTSESAKKLIDNLKPLLIPIAKWLGVGISFLLGGLGL